jgi:mono/diheme cytochrome c family protein
MRIWNWGSSLGAPRPFATCCPKRQERTARGKKQKANGKSRGSGFGIRISGSRFRPSLCLGESRTPDPEPTGLEICHLKCFLFVPLVIMGCLTVCACHKKSAAGRSDRGHLARAWSVEGRPLLEAYDTEQDWNDPQHTIALNYQQAQGKRVFYNNCVWCHADATPAGPSNRGNLTPNPPLMNDGTTLNGVSDEFMQNIITLGGSAMGKSAIMPPWGLTLTADEVRAVIAFARAIAQPPYKPPLQPAPQYPVK